MASVLESDYRASHFPMHGQDYRQAPYTPPPPPPYYVLPSSGCNPTMPYIPQYPLLNSIQHISNDYDGFVNGVISDVLIRVDDGSGFAYKQPHPYDEKIAPQNYYNPPQNTHHQNQNQNLMWGSDVSFGPAGYQPSSPPVAQIKSEPAPLYGLHPVQHQIQSQTPTPSATPLQLPLPLPRQHAHQHTHPLPKQDHHHPQEFSPESETVQLETQDDNPPELAELNKSGMQKITGKKRRRLLHIIAERNRRLHQNKMYEELYKMVPGLENRSRSTKREVLMRTADWMEDLVEGNRRLRVQLRQMNGQV